MDLVNISQKIRTVRKKQNMTVAMLAEKSGLSKGFISRLENFRINASIKALVRISDALGISMSDLFSDSEESSVEYLFGHIDEGEKVVRNESDKYGLSYFSLAYKKTNRRLEPFLIEYSPSKRQRRFLMHEADEFYLLLEGEVIFCIGDDANCRKMSSGDTLYLSRNLPHCVYLAEGCDYARSIVVYDKDASEGK